MRDAVPGAKPVREEDAFDVEAVATWLRTHAADATGLDGTPEVRQFSGGASNLTYLLRYPGTRDLILRRAPVGTKARGAHDMHREFAIQTALAPVFAYVAPMVAFCDDPSVIGADFYAMERIEGVIPAASGPPTCRSRPSRRARCAWARSTCSSSCTAWMPARPVSPGSARARATCAGRSRAGRCATATRAPTTSPTTRT